MIIMMIIKFNQINIIDWPTRVRVAPGRQRQRSEPHKISKRDGLIIFFFTVRTVGHHATIIDRDSGPVTVRRPAGHRGAVTSPADCRSPGPEFYSDLEGRVHSVTRLATASRPRRLDGPGPARAGDSGESRVG